jgi:hypothetical protein
MALLRAIPAMPVLDIERAVDYYVTRLGFEKQLIKEDFGIVSRHGVVPGDRRRYSGVLRRARDA